MAKHKHDLPHSTSISCCEYDDETKKMHLIFASGGKHEFSDVDRATFDALKDAKSPGSHFHQHIRRQYKSVKVD